MSAPLRRWPSWPSLGMDLLDNGRQQRGMPAVPSRLSYVASVDPLPCYVVSVLEAPASRLLAEPIIEVETLAERFSQAEELAYDADEIFMGYPLSTSSGGRVVLVDRVDAVSSPVELDLEGESKIRRFLATYRLTVRRV